MDDDILQLAVADENIADTLAFFDVLRQEVLQEAALMLDYARPEKTCVFRSNHASNYVSLKGDLPRDNDRMIEALKRCMKDKSLIKNELFRAL